MKIDRFARNLKIIGIFLRDLLIYHFSQIVLHRDLKYSGDIIYATQPDTNHRKKKLVLIVRAENNLDVRLPIN